MKKIIHATDFSEQAAAAFDQAVNVAKRADAELYLVHALDEAMRDHYDEAHERLDEMRERCISAGVKTFNRIIIGFPDAGITSTATDIDADLIVVGTHGRSGVQRFLIGSVAERVVRMSDTNILVARPRSKGTEGYNHILVPSDFSETAEHALAMAIALVSDGGVVELFHSWQLPGAVTGYWGPAADQSTVLDPLRHELRDSAEAQCRELIARHGKTAKLIFSETEDTASHGIRRRLESDSYDLVVMGSHGRRGFRRWVLGSVAETTVRYAPCSTVVVHAERAQR